MRFVNEPSEIEIKKESNLIESLGFFHLFSLVEELKSWNIALLCSMLVVVVVVAVIKDTEKATVTATTKANTKSFPILL